MPRLPEVADENQVGASMKTASQTWHRESPKVAEFANDGGKLDMVRCTLTELHLFIAVRNI